MKRLAGNPGKRPLNTREPKPAKKAPQPPAATKKRRDALACWRRLVPELAALGIIATIDREAMATYCDAWADFCWGVDQVKHGLTTVTDKGNVIQHPAVSIKNAAAERLRKLAQEFGLTPSARSRIEVEDAEEAQDEGPGRLLSRRSGLKSVAGGRA